MCSLLDISHNNFIRQSYNKWVVSVVEFFPQENQLIQLSFFTFVTKYPTNTNISASSAYWHVWPSMLRNAYTEIFDLSALFYKSSSCWSFAFVSRPQTQITLQKSSSWFLTHSECISVTWSPSKLSVCFGRCFCLHACSGSTTYGVYLYWVLCTYLLYLVWKWWLQCVVTVCVCSCASFPVCWPVACLTSHDLALCRPLFSSLLLLGIFAFFPLPLLIFFFLENILKALYSKKISLQNSLNSEIISLAFTWVRWRQELFMRQPVITHTFDFLLYTGLYLNSFFHKLLFTVLICCCRCLLLTQTQHFLQMF